MKKLLIVIIAAFSIFAGCDKSSPEAASNQSLIPRMDSAGFDALKAENRGKVLAVNIFASWCPPCKVETPDFVTLYNEISGEKFEMVGFSIDKSVKDLAAFIEKHNITYPIYIIDAKLQRRLFADKVPTTIFYTPDGRVFTTAMGMIDKATLREIVTMAGKS